MKVVPTFHPSFIQRGNWDKLHLVKHDVQVAAREAQSSKPFTPRPVRYITNPTPSEASRFLDPTDERPLVIDIETVRETGEIVCCGVGREKGEVVCMPWREPYREMLAAALRSDKSLKVAHNIGFDFPRLAEDLGLALSEIAGTWFDTLEASAVCRSDLPKNLESVASLYFDRHPWKESKRQGEISLEWYNCLDVDATMWALEGLSEDMRKLGVEGVFYDITMPAVPVMISMHETGIRVNLDRMAEVRKEFEEREAVAQELLNDFAAALPHRGILRSRLLRAAELLDAKAEELWVPGTKRRAGKMRTKAKRLREQAEGLGSVSVSSTKQLAEFLYTDLALPDQKSTDVDAIVALLMLTKGRGKYRVDERYVPMLKAVLEYRRMHKMISTYLSYECDHLHPRFLLWGTATGRLSSRDPNIQNIPKRWEEAWKIRSIFEPPVPGWVFSEIDYSQLERRIQAIIWDDKPLQETYAKGLDTHTATAARMFGVEYEQVTKDQRNVAKTAVYGQSYGMGPDKYRRDQAKFGNYISMADARSFLDAVSKAHPGVAAGQAAAIAHANEQNHLRNAFGRIRWFLGPDPYGDAMNFLPQSNAADIILTAMNSVFYGEVELPKPEFVLVAQIHDALLVAHPPGEGERVRAYVQAGMEQPFRQFGGARFPTDADADGLNWSFREES